MFEWFKRNDIGRKLKAAVEDVINGDGWGPFEGLEKGGALVKVILVKGQIIRFEKYISPDLNMSSDYPPLTSAEVQPVKIEIIEDQNKKPKRKRTVEDS
jgi:hypothetical protein